MRRAVTALIILAIVVALGALLFRKPVPERITYGVSFNTPYARELGLDPRETYLAILDELKVRHLRLAAHWSMVEPSKDTFDFTELDFQLAEADKRGAEVIMGVGRRLPRWPECHVPPWAKDLTWEEQKGEIRAYITETVNRYKGYPSIVYWQVENEPYLGVFASEHCGELDEAFLKEEIELVRSLDGTRPILVTDSGNLGTWAGAYRAGDAFGTSVYVYFWNPDLGQFKTVLPPAFYRAKENLMQLFYGEKKTFLIELAAEPWLLEPVTNVPLDVQYSRMDVEKFEEILDYAKDTRFDVQYLWGAEWWYWLHKQGESHMWERAKELYKNGH
jgi:hypothetical protein